MTQEQLNEILLDNEFNECIDEAAPYRVKIIQDITPQMKEVQDAFLQLMIEANYKNVSDIMKKLEIDKKDPLAKDEYSKWKKQTMNLFRATLKTIHPNENQTPSIGMLYVAGSLLTYIGREDLINDNPNVDSNNSLSFKKFEDVNSFFMNNSVKDRMKQIFEDADDIQGMMCENSDKIKKDMFDRLPGHIRFDKDLNKGGIKQNQFCALVRHKAMGMIKDKDKYTKYISAQIDNSNNSIGRETVVLGKTKQM